MLTRRLGRTGHESTLLIAGGASFWTIDQEGANAALDLAARYGVNHFDVAPQYGNAQAVLGPWLEPRRAEFFISCKTLARTRDAAWAELHESLELLRTDHLELYQFHAITTPEQLDHISGPGGAFEAFQRAREEGVVQHLGITGHGMDAPRLQAEAVRRMDLDTVMFPINPRLYADAAFRADAEALLALAQERDLGVMIIKAGARGPWGRKEKEYNPWYEPFDTRETLEPGLRFALSQPGVTCLATPGDVRLWETVFQIANDYSAMSAEEQTATIAEHADDVLIFDGPQPISK